MKNPYPKYFVVVLLLASWCAPNGRASLIFSEDFEGPPSVAYSVFQEYNPPAPTVVTDATGTFMRLANAGVDSQNNFLAFDSAAGGSLSSAVISFDFRMGGFFNGIAPADGLGIALLSTANYGSSGAYGGTEAEEPRFAGSLGIGLDTYYNGSPNDPSDNHLSLHWDGSLLGSYDATIDLNDNEWHGATLNVDFTTGLVSFEIGGVTQFSEMVPGMSQYDFRLQFGGRTGAGNDNHDIDNVSLSGTTVPDGGAGTASALIFALAGLGVFAKTRTSRR